MDIEGLGEKLAKELARQDLVSNIAEIFIRCETARKIYSLRSEWPRNVPKTSSTPSKSQSRNRSRGSSSHSASFGVGSEIAETLARELRTLPGLLQSDEEKLTDIEGIGPILAKSVREWSHNEANIRLVQQLQDHGLTIEDDSPEPVADHPIKGKIFVITGKLDEVFPAPKPPTPSKPWERNLSAASPKRPTT